MLKSPSNSHFERMFLEFVEIDLPRNNLCSVYLKMWLRVVFFSSSLFLLRNRQVWCSIHLCTLVYIGLNGTNVKCWRPSQISKKKNWTGRVGLKANATETKHENWKKNWHDQFHTVIHFQVYICYEIVSAVRVHKGKKMLIVLKIGQLFCQSIRRRKEEEISRYFSVIFM